MLRKPTAILRRTVTEQGRVILAPEDPPTGVRRVQVLTEASVALAIGPSRFPFPKDANEDDLRSFVDAVRSSGGLLGVDDADPTPAGIAESRTYQWPVLGGGVATTSFLIAPEQWLVAASIDPNVADLTLIVEHIEGA